VSIGKSLVKLFKACRVQGRRPCSLTKERRKEEKTTLSETKKNKTKKTVIKNTIKKQPIS